MNLEQPLDRPETLEGQETVKLYVLDSTLLFSLPQMDWGLWEIMLFEYWGE